MVTLEEATGERRRTSWLPSRPRGLDDLFITRLSAFFTRSGSAPEFAVGDSGSACQLIPYLFPTVPAVHERRRNSKPQEARLRGQRGDRVAGQLGLGDEAAGAAVGEH